MHCLVHVKVCVPVCVLFSGAGAACDDRGAATPSGTDLLPPGEAAEEEGQDAGETAQLLRHHHRLAPGRFPQKKSALITIIITLIIPIVFYISPLFLKNNPVAYLW